jgi:hypothetical protein
MAFFADLSGRLSDCYEWFFVLWIHWSGFSAPLDVTLPRLNDPEPDETNPDLAWHKQQWHAVPSETLTEQVFFRSWTSARSRLKPVVETLARLLEMVSRADRPVLATQRAGSMLFSSCACLRHPFKCD